MSTPPHFRGLRVLSLESRRRSEIASLITTYGGTPVSAPAMREVALETNEAAFASVVALACQEYDVFVTLTGVGLRALLEIAERSIGRARFAAALAATRVVARGPKPLAVLRELGIAPWVLAHSPNTWREVLSALDAKGPDAVRGRRVAVQEYGVAPDRLIAGLEQRGALVTRVPVYLYALPEDVAPLEGAVRALADSAIDVVLFTTAVQVAHLVLVAERLSLREPVVAGLRGAVVASIGPSTSEELREQGLDVDLEASPPKMGELVRMAAAEAPELLARKRQPRA